MSRACLTGSLVGAQVGLRGIPPRFIEGLRDGLLEGPSYTRPVSWRDLEVPPILLSGDHAKMAAWRHEQSLERTRARRPDLLGPNGEATV